MVSVCLGDSNNKRKQVVREKTAWYLLQAEKIYIQHLASKSAELSVWDVRIILFAMQVFVNICHASPLLSYCWGLSVFRYAVACPLVANKYINRL